ncbi:hypothetical protein D3C73_1052020 [compost metagenome]
MELEIGVYGAAGFFRTLQQRVQGLLQLLECLWRGTLGSHAGGLYFQAQAKLQQVEDFGQHHNRRRPQGKSFGCRHISHERTDPVTGFDQARHLHARQGFANHRTTDPFGRHDMRFGR